MAASFFLDIPWNCVPSFFAALSWAAKPLFTFLDALSDAVPMPLKALLTVSAPTTENVYTTVGMIT
jgi:hypothetical protein